MQMSDFRHRNCGHLLGNQLIYTRQRRIDTSRNLDGCFQVLTQALQPWTKNKSRSTKETREFSFLNFKLDLALHGVANNIDTIK